MSLIQAGNVRLNVVERGRGTPLLLVHGYPLDHSMWQGQIDGLADSSRVIAPDLRGFGTSDVPGGRVTRERRGDDLGALIDAIKIKVPFFFGGLWGGGYVAWQFALGHRARVASERAPVGPPVRC